MFLKKALLAGAMAFGLAATPAHALLNVYITDGTTVFTCADGQGGCDFGGGANNVLTLNTQVGNFFVAGTLSTSVSGGDNKLDFSTFQLTNTSGAVDTLTMFVTNNGFLGPVTNITNSGAVTFHDNAGVGPSSLQFYADATNAANTIGNPGGLLFTALGTPLLAVDSFQGTADTPFAANGLFSMAMRADFLLASNAYVTGYAQGMDATTGAVPEPATWGMMLLGFAGIGLYGMQKRRRKNEEPLALAA